MGRCPDGCHHRRPYAGESYDARRAEQLTDWTISGFRDEAWRPAAVVDGPGGPAQAYPGEPIRTGSTIAPVSVRTATPGVRVYDFGVTLAGWARLRGRLPAGSTVRLTYGERLTADGRVEVGVPGWYDNPSVVGRFQTDEFTAAGLTEETWEPSFTHKGFRYVEITGTAEPLELHAVPVGSDLSSTMDLTVDHPVLQWIVDAARQTSRNSLHGLPDGSPQHSKMGWTFNTHFAGQTMLYQFGVAGLFAKWLDDIRLSQAPSGELTLLAPMGDGPLGFLLSPASSGSTRTWCAGTGSPTATTPFLASTSTRFAATSNGC